MTAASKNSMTGQPRFLISGGGTGGHLYPALAVADALKTIYPDAAFLFAGAIGKIEMQKVPAAGYEIIGLPIRGLDRSRMLNNLTLLPKVLYSLFRSFSLIRKFKPDVVIGTGGYASAPVVFAASFKKIPILLQEQNAFPGMTNKVLAKYADKICVAYEKMEKELPAGKIVISGNPVRKDIKLPAHQKADSLKQFGLKPGAITLLVLGGSGGARSINNAISKNLNNIQSAGINLIWQTGAFYFDAVKDEVGETNTEQIYVSAFIDKMAEAYNAADIVVARAGAITISELAVCGKAAILVPSPNVAGDHQRKNALTLLENNAVKMVEDINAADELIEVINNLANDETERIKLQNNILKMARPDAAKNIADEVIKLINTDKKQQTA